MRFTYTYKTSDGVRHEGAIEARSKSEAFTVLRKQGIRPIKMFDPPKSTWQKIGFRWPAIAILGAFVIVLLFRLQTAEKIPEALPRRQIYGDAATIEGGVKTDWAEVFQEKGDRFLAHFVQPGKVDAPPPITVNAVQAVLGVKARILKDDSDEVRQVKCMLNGIKNEARAYLAAGGRLEVYMERLEERQRMEDAYFAKTAAELKKLEQFVEGKGAQVKESVLHEWKTRNGELKAMGLRTIPVPDILISGD